MTTEAPPGWYPTRGAGRGGAGGDGLDRLHGPVERRRGPAPETACAGECHPRLPRQPRTVGHRRLLLSRGTPRRTRPCCSARRSDSGSGSAVVRRRRAPRHGVLGSRVGRPRWVDAALGLGLGIAGHHAGDRAALEAINSDLLPGRSTWRTGATRRALRMIVVSIWSRSSGPRSSGALLPGLVQRLIQVVSASGWSCKRCSSDWCT